VHPLIERAAAYSWRLLVIAAAGLAVLWLVGQLWVVFLGLIVATFLARVLDPPAARLRSVGWPPALVAAVTLLGFLVALAATVTVLGVAIRGEVDQFGPTISEAVDDLERWLVEDAPIDVSQADVDRFRADVGDTIGQTLRSSTGTILSGTVFAAQLVVGLVLSLVLTFFQLKDGRRFLRFVQQQLPAERRDLAGRITRRAWGTLGGYLRGAAVLGLVEGVVIATTVALVGGELAVPVGVLTFILAFIPFVGAIVAGILAVLVTLATANGGAALIVLVVAFVVQQVDNELLAPVIYGRALQLHPVVVLLALAAGGALFGVAGTFLSVPLMAIVFNVVSEVRASPTPAPDVAT
jgi:predicted PurR-regulated permease PerM